MLMRGIIRGLAVAAAVLPFSPQLVSGQEKYPSHPIEMIIPTPPGGGTDISLRALADIAEPMLGQKIAVINKPGGSGMIGMAAVVQAKPDGYTIGGLWNAPLTMTPNMLPAPYKPSDYTPISLSTWAPTLLCTKKDFPANTGKELVETIRKNPDKYTYGNDGIGATIQLAVERILHKLDLKARGIPFGGAGETLKAFLGGHVDIYAGSIAPIQPYLKDGTAKCLIVTSAERNPALPQAASLTDLGIPDEGTVLWRGIVVPNGVSADRVALLEKVFREAAQSDRFKQFMEARGEEARGSSGTEMRKLIDGEHAAMGTVMKTIGLVK